MAGVLLDTAVRDSNSAQRPIDNTVSNGKVFITRHGERADLADENWLAQAEVSCATWSLCQYDTLSLARAFFTCRPLTTLH